MLQYAKYSLSVSCTDKAKHLSWRAALTGATGTTEHKTKAHREINHKTFRPHNPQWPFWRFHWVSQRSERPLDLYDHGDPSDSPAGARKGCRLDLGHSAHVLRDTCGSQSFEMSPVGWKGIQEIRRRFGQIGCWSESSVHQSIHIHIYVFLITTSFLLIVAWTHTPVPDARPRRSPPQVQLGQCEAFAAATMKPHATSLHGSAVHVQL